MMRSEVGAEFRECAVFCAEEGVRMTHIAVPELVAHDGINQSRVRWPNIVCKSNVYRVVQ